MLPPARVRMLANQQEAVRRSIEDYRTRLAAAREKLAELDRPQLRRRHRAEIDRARSEVTTLPGSIEGGSGQARGARAPGAQGQDTSRWNKTPDFAAGMPTPSCGLWPWIGSGGRPPAGPSAISGSIRPDGLRSITLPSSCTERRSGVPPLAPFGQDAYAASHWAAVQAVDRLDPALGRQLEIEPPHRSLGRSL